MTDQNRSGGKDCSSICYSIMETVAARWAGAPEIGDAELDLKRSRRVGEQDRRGRGTG